ncbi:hypothetical protein ACN4EE_07915 [Geminocystis sp. CENA526]
MIIVKDLWLETARKKGNKLPDEKLAISKFKRLYRIFGVWEVRASRASL